MAAGGDVIAIADLGSRDVAAWRDLAARAAEPNPFFEPEAVLPAARHLGERHAGLLVVRDGAGDWLACMPVVPRLRRRHGTMPALTAWRHRYGCLGTPLVDGAAVATATERLLDRSLRAAGRRMLVLPWLGDDGPVAAALSAALRAAGREPAVHRSFTRAVLTRATLDGGPDTVISARHRRDLRRLLRRLTETLDGPLELSDDSDRPDAAADFMALEASGWKGRAGTALRCRPAHAAYFAELCDGFRAAGRLQLLALGTDRQTVSWKCNLLSGDAVFCFKIAHDEAFDRFRPGLQLEVAMLEQFRDRMTAEWMDSCADPDSKLFAHFWPERRRIGSYVLLGGHPVIGRTVGRGIGRLGRGAAPVAPSR
ncbi:MAG: GNAT family N-acetyltransferase [Solirubrobacteraceae bacterium]|jgi:CelD/BcsL family acetyltransferase involved in cellulose biosynthesis